MRPLVVIFLGSYLQCATGKQQSEFEAIRVLVNTSRGAVRGFHVDNSLLKNVYKGEADVFLGIPYAVPPVGEKRFKKAELHGSYPNVIDANRFGNLCPQTGNDEHSRVYDTPIDENCLTLNIFAPTINVSAERYPVMVYLYGGALKFGDIAEFEYHGIVSNLVRRGVVWVSLNYRVGMLGFFTTYTSEFPANRGIWDQVVALRWIQEEIAHFGGDPNRVTLIGHSAGACAASGLALSPAVDPSLFHGIILQSCAAEVCFEQIYGKFTQSFDRAEQICGVNARTEGWTSANVRAMEHCLSKLHHSELNAYDSQTFRWNMVVDDDLFPDFPSKLRWRNIPVLMGSTADEYTLYAQWSMASGHTTLSDYTSERALQEIKNWLRNMFDNRTSDEILKAIEEEYGTPKDVDPLNAIQYFSRVLSDLIYIRAVGNEALAHVHGGNDNVWLWQVDFHTDYFSFFRFENYKPVFHGMDLFLLMQPDHAWVDGDQTTRWGDEELAVSDRIAHEFTHFAKYGHPTDKWQRLNPNRLNYWRIDGASILKGVDDYPDGYGGERFRFWHRLLTQQLSSTVHGQTPSSTFAQLHPMDEL